jgi:hypothetical protein
MRIIGAHPEDREMFDALAVAADVVNVDVAWFYRGKFHLRVTRDWTVALSPESAGRCRVSTCECTVERATRWTRPSDHARLEQLVREAVDDILISA